MLLRLTKGDDKFQVEKKLLKEQKRNEEKQKRHEENLNSQTSIFDIINQKLFVVGNEGNVSICK